MASKKLNIAVQALEYIVDPISSMKKELKEGEKLSGLYAYQLSNDPNYLKNIAKEALKKIEELN